MHPITRTLNQRGKKQSKSPKFVQLKTHQRMCSDDENQFQTRLAHVRTCFQHYFENFEEKVDIGHFGFWHPCGESIGVPKAKVTDLNFFLKIFKIMLETCSYMC